MSYVDLIDSRDVKTVEDLIEYVRSRFGVIVTWKDKVVFRTRLKEFLADNPHLGDSENAVSIIAKAVDWAKSARRKCTTLCGVFFLVSYAFAAGWLPELDPSFAINRELEDGILEALAVETDDGWRTRLIASEGPARVRALKEWRERVAAVA